MSFYGATSGFAFVMRTMELFQRPGTQLALEARTVVAGLFDAPLPSREMLNLPELLPLPVHAVAPALVDAVFSRCHPLLQFLEQTDFREMMNHIYEDFQQHGTSDARSITLLHFVVALGYLFSVEFHQEQCCKAALSEA